MDAAARVPAPVNEPIHDYAPGSVEREALERRLAELAGEGPVELPHSVGGRELMGEGKPLDVVQPHARRSVLGTLRNATTDDARAAVDAALAAGPAWRALPFEERAAVFLKAAELLSGPWRYTLNAATMLGQSKTAYQAEIDSACELIDFWRFNVHFAAQLLADQPPANSKGVWNRTDHRPLEGFVYAITPFNFTAIAGNLPTAPALMGNTVVWKPSPTQQLAAHYTMRLLEAAGLPPGVINLVTGNGAAASAASTAARASSVVAFHSVPKVRCRACGWTTSIGFPPPPTSRASISRVRRRPSRTCGVPWRGTSTRTAATRGSWARPAARTSSSRIPRPTSRRCGRR